MKKLVVITLLVLCMGALAMAQKKEKGGEPTISGVAARPVTSGQVTLLVNSYGNLPDVDGELIIAGTNHVYEYVNFVSINNGAVEATGDFGWSIVNALAVSGGTATSTVQRGDTLQVDFNHTVVDNGGGLADWLLSVSFTNLTDQDLNLCYFPYMDYDLFNNPLDDVSAYADADPDLGVPAIRVHKSGRDEIFVFADSDEASSDWRNGAQDTVHPLVSRGRNCIDLGSTASSFGPGDFAGAFKIPLTIAAGEKNTATVDLRFGRIQ